MIVGLAVYAYVLEPYYHYSHFPKPQQSYMAWIRERGRYSECGAHGLEGLGDRGPMELDACFAVSKFERDEVVKGDDRNRDELYSYFSCKTKIISARFVFIQDRTSDRAYCESKVANAPAEAPAIGVGDFAYYSDEPDPLLKFLIWLVN